MNKQLLIVEDDKEIVRVLRAYLEQAGFHVHTAYNGQAGLALLAHETFDLIILDLMLPDKDGLDITRFIRSQARLAHLYILMLTARVEDTDKILGLELGADDYVTKPFNPREIVARVRAVFRRQQDYSQQQDTLLTYEGLIVDPLRRLVTVDGRKVDLTPMEFSLLVTLLQQPGIPFSRSDLIQKRHGYDYESLERTLDSHIRNLRKKIEPDPGAPTYVQTVYGIGYRLGDPS
ncbi:MAG: response regulator transcription factor [Anaerolineae bacterium]|jgi:two-component system alkaline phosphatase synthesis response regulator PhoP|nr:response regulator transcription factor [Anaerolineae bacterium]